MRIVFEYKDQVADHRDYGLVAYAPLGAQHGIEALGGQLLQAGAFGREALGHDTVGTPSLRPNLCTLVADLCLTVALGDPTHEWQLRGRAERSPRRLGDVHEATATCVNKINNLLIFLLEESLTHSAACRHARVVDEHSRIQHYHRLRERWLLRMPPVTGMMIALTTLRASDFLYGYDMALIRRSDEPNDR